MHTRYAVPLTILFVKDEDAWVALACEVTVASQGDSLDEARSMIQDAVGLWASYEMEEGAGPNLGRPASPEHIAEFLGDAPPEDRVVEYHTLLLEVETDPEPEVLSIEFLPSVVRPACVQFPVAA